MSDSNSGMRNGSMNRIGWFTYLRTMFENCQPDDNITIWRIALLNELLIAQNNLPLKEIKKNLETEIQLGLRDVYNAIDKIPSNKISFDQIIDAVVSLNPPLNVFNIYYNSFLVNIAKKLNQFLLLMKSINLLQIILLRRK